MKHKVKVTVIDKKLYPDLQKHYVLCGIARIGILSDDINGEVNIA